MYHLLPCTETSLPFTFPEEKEQKKHQGQLTYIPASLSLAKNRTLRFSDLVRPIPLNVTRSAPSTSTNGSTAIHSVTAQKEQRASQKSVPWLLRTAPCSHKPNTTATGLVRPPHLIVSSSTDPIAAEGSIAACLLREQTELRRPGKSVCSHPNPAL